MPGVSVNGLAEGLIISLVPIAVINTGALIYFCGGVKASLHDLGSRVKRLERLHDGELFVEREG